MTTPTPTANPKPASCALIPLVLLMLAFGLFGCFQNPAENNEVPSLGQGAIRLPAPLKNNSNAGKTNISVPPAPAFVQPNNTAAATFSCNGTIIGTMARSSLLKSSAFYAKSFQDNFAWGTVAGAQEFHSIHPIGPEYDFRAADAALDILENNGKHYGIFHNLILARGIKVPQWYKMLGTFERRAVLEEHIKTTVTRYKGRIPVYIVVNHPLLWNWESESNFMGTGWTRVEALTNFFKWAHESDPDALLILNEGGEDSLQTGVIINASRTREYAKLATDLLERDAPIGGIGIMGHFGLGTATLPPDSILIESLDILSATGLPIYVSELDISYDWTAAYVNPQSPSYPFNPNAQFQDGGITYGTYWDYQAYALKHAMELFASHEAVDAIYLWDIVESPQSWREGTGLFFANGTPMPAYWSVKPLLERAMENNGCLPK